MAVGGRGARVRCVRVQVWRGRGAHGHGHVGCAAVPVCAACAAVTCGACVCGWLLAGQIDMAAGRCPKAGTGKLGHDRDPDERKGVRVLWSLPTVCSWQTRDGGEDGYGIRFGDSQVRGRCLRGWRGGSQSAAWGGTRVAVALIPRACLRLGAGRPEVESMRCGAAWRRGLWDGAA